MLTAQLFGTGNRWHSLPDALALLWEAVAWRHELRQLLDLLAERTDRRLHPLPWALPVPLRDDAPWIHREGVLWHEPSHTDLLFVTVNKSEALFSPSTRTRDLALGRSRRGGCRGWGWRFENSQTGPTKGPAP
jgi:hypothetical protein